MKMRSEMEGMKMTHEKKLEYFKQKLGKKDKELKQVSEMKERMEIEKEKHISFQLPTCFGSIWVRYRCTTPLVKCFFEVDWLITQLNVQGVCVLEDINMI